jgi:hypothetical protein
METSILAGVMFVAGYCLGRMLRRPVCIHLEPQIQIVLKASQEGEEWKLGPQGEGDAG